MFVEFLFKYFVVLAFFLILGIITVVILQIPLQRTAAAALINLDTDVTVSKFPTSVITKGLKSVHGITLADRLRSMRLVEKNVEFNFPRSVLLTCNNSDKYLNLFAIYVHKPNCSDRLFITDPDGNYAQYIIMHFAFSIPNSYLVVHPVDLGSYNARHLGDHCYKTGDSHFDSRYTVLTNDDAFAEQYMTKDRIAILLETDCTVHINKGNLFVSQYFCYENFLVLTNDETVKESYDRLLSKTEKFKRVFCL